ncbi:MAG TPA: hypothetical protein VN802_00290 [Stellaceae bacterium]|nr:hypothetical protein [Stellaceae bacterium]
MRRALAPDPADARRLAERHGVADGKFLVFDASAGVPALDGMDAAVAMARDGRALAACDRALFDRGFLRLDDDTLAPASLYLRSSRISDVNALGGRTRGTVAMSNLGHNAGFANQLFQYAFLKLYGLRNNAAIETPPWLGETVYGLPRRRISRALRMRKGDEWSVRDLALWSMERAPVDVDFWGYYQNVPESWRQHRAFLRRLYEPLPPWRAPVERWLARHVPAGATLVAIHLRRGDYRAYDPAQKPWFQLIPEEWYLRWLDAVWPGLANPVLFVASDDRAAVLPSFRRFAPLTSAEAEAEMPEPRLIADLEIMAQANLLAICNSSFSRVAALLAPPSQRCFIPAIATQNFEPYDPWATDHFWQRFGAPEPRRRSLLPRFLRRKAP